MKKTHSKAKTEPVDNSHLNLYQKEILYDDLLRTAFSPDTPDRYAKYLQDILIKHQQTTKEIDWTMEAFSYMLNPQTGKITIWG